MAKAPTITPQQQPCVVCNTTPTVGFAHREVQKHHGRVCRVHAKHFADAGEVVAYDDRAVVNWPTRI